MEKRGLSPAQFADEIGLKRSSLSHILSGRNNPSLDVIMKIKARYDEVNTDWLLFGTGLPVGREEKTRKSEK
ncbi:MAG: helix-turn-helix domain-containing protein, partial [Bacteroidetes bacterium]|nr:helix-turn-helix domain-containing protein [Bacteroidota bacterium]